jgi:hypothetical protein
MGYYGIFVGLQYKNNHNFSSVLYSEKYAENESITIRVPLALPYHISDQEFTKTEGKIQYEGNFYRLVKQKLVNDTLLIVCVRDGQETKIAEALADYVKTFADNSSNTSGQTKTVISFIKDFLPSDISISTSVAGWSKKVTFALYAPSLQSRQLVPPTQPPRLLS